MTSVEEMTSTTTKFYIITETGGRTYNKNAIDVGTAAARTAGIRFTQAGTVIDCPNTSELDRFYLLLHASTTGSSFDVTTRFKDLGKRAYFKVRGLIVQVWALVSHVNGKDSEGAGPANPSIWLPVYCSIDAFADGTYDNPRAASLTF